MNRNNDNSKEQLLARAIFQVQSKWIQSKREEKSWIWCILMIYKDQMNLLNQKRWLTEQMDKHWMKNNLNSLMVNWDNNGKKYKDT